MTTITEHAKAFAMKAHAGQVRKYTGEPYFTHLEEVAEILRGSVRGSVASENCSIGDAKSVVRFDVMAAAAYLHDTLEDCEVTCDELAQEFGTIVASYVWLLSDINQTGNRASRKLQTRLRLYGAGEDVQNIKCADIISNASSIIKHDPKFAKVYVNECVELLYVLTKADAELRRMAYKALCGEMKPEMPKIAPT